MSKFLGRLKKVEDCSEKELGYLTDYGLSELRKYEGQTFLFEHYFDSFYSFIADGKKVIFDIVFIKEVDTKFGKKLYD